MTHEERSMRARQRMRELGIRHLFDDKVKRLDIPLPDVYEKTVKTNEI